MENMLCPICKEPAIEEKIGADFEYVYIIAKCKNGHRFGIKKLKTQNELGRTRELTFRNRIKYLRTHSIKF